MSVLWKAEVLVNYSFEGETKLRTEKNYIYVNVY